MDGWTDQQNIFFKNLFEKKNYKTKVFFLNLKKTNFEIEKINFVYKYFFKKNFRNKILEKIFFLKKRG